MWSLAVEYRSLSHSLNILRHYQLSGRTFPNCANNSDQPDLYICCYLLVGENISNGEKSANLIWTMKQIQCNFDTLVWTQEWRLTQSHNRDDPMQNKSLAKTNFGHIWCRDCYICIYQSCILKKYHLSLKCRSLWISIWLLIIICV